MGIDKDLIKEKNLYHALIGNCTLQDVIVTTAVPHLDMAPCNRDLIGVEVEFVNVKDRGGKLRILLQQMGRSYDFTIIDCPPSLGFLTVNALTASDYLIIPLQCEYFAMEGLGHLINTIRLIKAKLNPSLTLGGILLTMYDSRNLLSRRVSEDVRKYFGSKVFNTVIPRNVRLSESPSHGLPIILYDIKSRGALAYMELAQEILSNGRLV
jgi:chromosome partitioning protein